MTMINLHLFIFKLLYAVVSLVAIMIAQLISESRNPS